MAYKVYFDIRTKNPAQAAQATRAFTKAGLHVSRVELGESTVLQLSGDEARVSPLVQGVYQAQNLGNVTKRNFADSFGPKNWIEVSTAREQRYRRAGQRHVFGG